MSSPQIWLALVECTWGNVLWPSTRSPLEFIHYSLQKVFGSSHSKQNKVKKINKLKRKTFSFIHAHYPVDYLVLYSAQCDNNDVVLRAKGIDALGKSKRRGVVLKFHILVYIFNV